VSSNSRMSTKSKSPLKRAEIIDDSETERLFADAMADVKRLEVKKTAPRVNGPRQSKDASDEGSEIEQLLREFVRGEADFDWSLHPGYQEGGPEQRNRKLIRKLRRGEFAVQDKLDLHGLSQKEAEIELDAFLADCVSRNLRCVRIIHGKGNNSRNQDGVLRKSVPRWLSTKRRARLIIAFTTAPPQDGGIGATYVLLRKRPLPRNRSLQNRKD
jgi:DNA-nicking Smr family endonuclease